MLKNISAKTSFALGILAVIALILVLAIFLVIKIFLADNSGSGNNQQNSAQKISLAQPTKFDHLRGSLFASIIIVEFADLECPYCKEFQAVMKKVYDNYQGQVAWVFRHYPIDSLHSKARKEAEAAECAAELGGNEKFWQYVDYVYNITPSNDGLDPQQLPEIAAAVGLNREKFSTCLASGKYAAKVDNDLQQALIAGGKNGTPYSVILIGSEKIPLSGAASYEQMKTALDALLQALKKE